MIAAALVLLFLVLLYAIYRIKASKYSEVDRSFPGPRSYPFVGNAFVFIGTSKAFYEKFMYFAQLFKTDYRVWMGPQAYVGVIDPKLAEAVLSSNVQIDKADEYEFIVPWIGYGLLTSTGAKWKKHRKILTPGFHFKILEKFVDVFTANGNILCEKLATIAPDEVFDVYQYIKLYALDVICETAMGVSVNAQKFPDSAYVHAVRDICEAVFQRSITLWLRPEYLYQMSKYGAMQRNALKIIHKTTEDVIKKRKIDFMNKKNVAELLDDEKELNVKQKMVFMDILLMAAKEQGLSDEDIRAEVDTFMFEGHDTVTSGISFAMYLLASHPQVQERVYQEQLGIFRMDHRDATYRDLQDMKYLEQVIKESLRLYPSVPMIGRKLSEDLYLDEGKYIPAGTQMILLLSALHRNPKAWAHPNVFDPDRFGPDAAQGKHPYSTVPFSAGPRNCIGQRFAMLEMKSTLSKIIRNFELIESTDPEDQPRITASVVLNSENGIRMKIKPRQTSTADVV